MIRLCARCGQPIWSAWKQRQYCDDCVRAARVRGGNRPYSEEAKKRFESVWPAVEGKVAGFLRRHWGYYRGEWDDAMQQARLGILASLTAHGDLNIGHLATRACLEAQKWMERSAHTIRIPAHAWARGVRPVRMYPLEEFRCVG